MYKLVSRDFSRLYLHNKEVTKVHDIDEMIYADPIDCKEHSTK